MQLGSFSNAVYTFCDWIARLAYINLLWILFTLSGFVVFGFFPATIAMLATLRQFIRKNHPPVFLIICYTMASYVEFEQPIVTHIKNALLITISSPLPSLYIIFGFAAVYFAVTYLSGVGFFFSISILGLVILSSANLAYKKIAIK